MLTPSTNSHAMSAGRGLRSGTTSPRTRARATLGGLVDPRSPRESSSIRRPLGRRNLWSCLGMSWEVGAIQGGPHCSMERGMLGRIQARPKARGWVMQGPRRLVPQFGDWSRTRDNAGLCSSSRCQKYRREREAKWGKIPVFLPILWEMPSFQTNPWGKSHFFCQIPASPRAQQYCHRWMLNKDLFWVRVRFGVRFLWKK